MKQRMPSLRTRLALSVMLVLLAVFFAIWVSFNTIVNGYIESRAFRQLEEARTHIDRDIPPRREPPEGAEADFSGAMQRINGAARRAVFVAPVQTMIATTDYALVSPETLLPAPAKEGVDIEVETPIGTAPDTEKNLSVLSVLREANVALDVENMQRVSVSDTLYYIISIPFEGGLWLPEGAVTTLQEAGARLVLYTDMTDVAALSETINRMLLLIIGVSALLAGGMIVLLSVRITRPIRALSVFAEALGQNDFTRRSLAVHDRELVELLGAMNRAAEQLDSYDKAQRTFFQNVSHELRTPLMSIKGYAEGIEVGVFEDNGQAAQIIVQESDRLTELVEDLLYISRADNLSPAYQTAPCDLRELLSTSALGLRGIALRQEKRIALDFAQEPVLVQGDERNLSRALGNILANGLRYAKETVTVSCTREGAEARIVISDDGLGIDAADLAHIFDRFYKGKGGKHGIGLSIAEAVVRQHGGTISARNRAQGGAEFAVSLPLLQECP